MPKDDQLYNSCLVQAVRNYPCLYNCNLKEYSSKKLTNEAWENVAEEMKDSAMNCKEKWRNLRIVFSRHLQKSLNGTSAGKSKYYLHEQMEFLRPFVRYRIGQVFLPYSAEGGKENPEVLRNDHDQVEIKKEISRSPSEISDDQLEGHFMEPSMDAPKYVNDNVLEENKSNSCINYNTDPPRKIIKYSYPLSIESNDNDLRKTYQHSSYRLQFLQSLLPDVEEMTSEQFRKFRKKVTYLIDELFESNPSTSSFNINSS